MRKSDCIQAKECKCSCQNCIQYKSNKRKNRDQLIMYYVNFYNNSKHYADVEKKVKEEIKGYLTESEYQVFLFEIQGKGI